MVIAVFGAGNIGTLLAAEMAYKGHDVRLVASDAGLWESSIDVYGIDDEHLFNSGRIQVMDDIEAALKGAGIVWITYPANLLKRRAADLLPYVKEGMLVGVVPGNGAEFFFSDHIDRGAVLFGLQRVHSIARLKERGKSVYMLGRKPELQVGVIPTSCGEHVRTIVEELLGIPTTLLPNYLVNTLTPSNPILHTSRLYAMFKDWVPGVEYCKNFLFYEDWDDASSGVLLACDGELQAICRKLEAKLDLDLSDVRSLKDHYESYDIPSMTRKISGISAFRGIESPMILTTTRGWIPNFDDRYFSADFAFGLKSVKDLGALAGVDTPMIDQIYGWYEGIAENSSFMDKIPDNLDKLALIYQR